MATETATVDVGRALHGLRTLRELTEDADGAQRVAWTDTWATARRWLHEELAAIDGVEVERDEAGNVWATAAGESERAVLIGGHLDSVPNGGWLDGALGTVSALEILRALAAQPRGLSVTLVDWADEEGARFGRSLFGSSAAAGTLDVSAVSGLTDRDGITLPDALAAHGVELHGVLAAGRRLENAVAYLELHIEQGPVLEAMELPLGVVLGTFGVQRHAVRFAGAHAHAGATPMNRRSDAFLAAARSALAFRDDAAAREDVRATTGVVKVSPGIVTAFNGRCELSLDQRALDPDVLGEMLAQARASSQQLAADEHCTVSWERLWEIEPIPFDRELIEIADAVVTEIAGQSHRLPSGPLHDAAEMARRLPTVMLFVKSLGGVSHTSAEDTPIEDLELAVRAHYELARRTLAWARER
ncbi:MAG: allantoate deiminase [Solirubrobacteraceae bacterium]|nr:allantoate deiminase [Solirubrobacteraceae bacterium]